MLIQYVNAIVCCYRYWYIDFVAVRKVRCSSTATRDPASYFLDPEVQTILRKVTGFDLAKIFAAKAVERSETPKYRFLTQQQFQEVSTQLCLLNINCNT